MMKRATKYLGLIFGVIPLGLASILSIALVIGINVLKESSHYFLPTLSVKYILLAFVFFILIIIIGFLIANIQSNTASLIIIFFLALIPRALVILFFQKEIMPFSDFLWSWDVAQGVREYRVERLEGHWY